MKVNSEFIIVPRILFNDSSLNKTDCLVLGLITSLTLKNSFCFASNAYLANYIKVSERTITYSLSKLKRLKYIIVKFDSGKRKIYLNEKVIPTSISITTANDFSQKGEVNCEHNINNKYKNKNYKLPKWMENPEMCKSEKLTNEELKELEELFKEFK